MQNESDHLFDCLYTKDMRALRAYHERGGSLCHTWWDRDATILHAVVSTNFVEAIPFLVAHGVSVDETDNYGQTALEAAALDENDEAAWLLLECGARVDQFAAAPISGWLSHMLWRREACLRAARTICGVLRKRRLPFPVAPDIARLLARYVWATRRDADAWTRAADAFSEGN